MKGYIIFSLAVVGMVQKNTPFSRVFSNSTINQKKQTQLFWKNDCPNEKSTKTTTTTQKHKQQHNLSDQVIVQMKSQQKLQQQRQKHKLQHNLSDNMIVQIK